MVTPEEPTGSLMEDVLRILRALRTNDHPGHRTLTKVRKALKLSHFRFNQARWFAAGAGWIHQYNVGARAVVLELTAEGKAVLRQLRGPQ